MRAELEFPNPEIKMRVDGDEIILSNTLALAPHAGQTMLDKLEHWAKLKPEALFLAQRDADCWQYLTYGEFFRNCSAPRSI